MAYIQRRPLINAGDYVVDDVDEIAPPRYRSGGMNTGVTVLFFVFLLLVIIVLLRNNKTGRDFGFSWGGDQVEVVASNSNDAVIQMAPTPRTVYREKAPVQPARRTVEAKPAVAEGAKRATPRTKDSRIVGYSWVLPATVNMRSGPGTEYGLINVLGEKQMVAVFDVIELDAEGELWSQVSIETSRGVQNGWIKRKYLSY